MTAHFNFTEPGLIRAVRPNIIKLSPSQRAAFIRRGNELFNAGNIDKARRFFLTAGYSDGVSRIGDYYYERNEFLLALEMYVLAPDHRKQNLLVEKITVIVKKWLIENTESNILYL